MFINNFDKTKYIDADMIVCLSKTPLGKGMYSLMAYVKGIKKDLLLRQSESEEEIDSLISQIARYKDREDT
jgi:hypothetical protein